MNYAAFKAYLTNFLWRQNDADLVANIDNLILMANHELSRTFNVEDRTVTLEISPTDKDYVLPSDFRHMNNLSNLEDTPGRVKEFISTTLTDVIQKRVQSRDTVLMPYYHVGKSNRVSMLYLVGPFSISNPGSLLLSYKANVPDYATTDASWVAEHFLDLYTYTVLSHCAPYLREDERLEVWIKKKVDALASAMDENEREVKFGGSPLAMKNHHQVPRKRRRF